MRQPQDKKLSSEVSILTDIKAILDPSTWDTQEELIELMLDTHYK